MQKSSAQVAHVDPSRKIMPAGGRFKPGNSIETDAAADGNGSREQLSQVFKLREQYRYPIRS